MTAMTATFAHFVLCFIPPHSTSYLQPCDVAVFTSFKSCIQAQTRRGGDSLVSKKAARAVDRNQAWSTGWRQLRARSDDDFREAVAKATELHSAGDMFAKQIEPEHALEDLVEWAMSR